MTAKRAGRPAPAGDVVTISRLCEVLNLSQRRIGQLVDEGMPRTGHGKYDLVGCCSWYIRYLQQVVEKNPRVQRGTDGTSVAIEKARNLALDSELRELKLKEARGELISVADQAALWEDAILRARSRSLSAIDGHLDDIVAAKTRARARDAALSVLHEFLEEVVRLGDQVEAEESAPGEAGEGGKARRRAKPRRSRAKPDEGDAD